jgi:hypothetical protein
MAEYDVPGSTMPAKLCEMLDPAVSSAYAVPSGAANSSLDPRESPFQEPAASKLGFDAVNAVDTWQHGNSTDATTHTVQTTHIKKEGGCSLRFRSSSNFQIQI